MKNRYRLLFAFFGLLFLFYPGDSYHFHIFAFNRNAFMEKTQQKNPSIAPVPYLKNPESVPYISSQGAYVVDLDSFTPVFSKNAKEKFLPASTAKIITALVASEIYKPEEKIKVGKIYDEGQTMGLIEGETITVENLLYGLLIHSGNDAAYAIANDYGLDGFVTLMNEKAKQLQMKSTNFSNPAGMDNGNQYSSPFDLTLAARELLKNPYLAKMVSIKQITISDVDFRYFHQLNNVNQLLGEITGIGGLKTGYTEEAGENLVSFYKNNGHNFIIVIMKSENRFNDTRNIIAWINENVAYITLPEDNYR